MTSSPHAAGEQVPIDQLIENERARIGHEIHDSLLPLLFAASGAVASAVNQLPVDATPSRQALDQASAWLTEAMEIGRRMLTEIYPPELIGTCWVRAAQTTIATLIDDPRIDIQWSVKEGVEVTSQAVALAAYRIVIEAVRNAIAHGGASQISVNATGDDESLEITVCDNGRGFDPTQIPVDRFGIQTINSRAALVGGSAEIDSQPGGPTSVKFRAPRQRDTMDRRPEPNG